MRFALAIFLLFVIASCNRPSATTTGVGEDEQDIFPWELISWKPYAGNPVFTGTGKDTWDQHIRERGYILKEDDGYHLWYTGYRDGKDPVMTLGYATSTDGIEWTRYDGNPVFEDSWVEDMVVVYFTQLLPSGGLDDHGKLRALIYQAIVD